MAKKTVNLFKKSREIETGPEQRLSDVSFIEKMKQLENSAEPLVQSETAKSLKTKRTTATIDEVYLEMMNNLMYTIRSSGTNKLLPHGDYALRSQDFWEQAIEAMSEKVKLIYGEIKQAP